MVYRYGAPYFLQKEGGSVELTRYSVIEGKNPREIVLLRPRLRVAALQVLRLPFGRIAR